MIKNDEEMAADQADGTVRDDPGQPRYRVNPTQPWTIMRGDQYVGVMFAPADAARVVAALNEQDDRFRAERWGS